MNRGIPVLLAALVAVLVGVLAYGIWFEVNDPGHGRITDKSYHAAWMHCTTNPVSCTSYPECYEIDYTDGRHDGDACVTPAEYAQYRIGDNYPAGAQ